MNRFCGKIVFPSKEAAKRKLKEIHNLNEKRKKKFYHDIHAPVRAYECKYCGGWHLTSQA